MRWNTVLFDLDGTLTESGEGIKKSFRYALAMMGIEAPEDTALDSVIGPPLKDSFRVIAGLDDEGCDRAIALYRQRYTSVGIYENALYPGVRECLQRLKAAGMTLAVASSKPEVMVRQILSYFGIDSYFSAIVGSNLDGTRSSKKAVIDETLRRLGMAGRRSEIVYAGDRKYDVVGARECGLASIGVTYGYGTFEELKAVKPTYMAYSAAHLVEVILSENRYVYPHRAQAESPRRAAGQAVPFIREERAIAKIWRIIYPTLLYFFISNAIFLVIVVIAMPFLIMSGQDSLDMTELFTRHTMAIQGAANLVIIPCMALFMRNDKKRRLALGNEKAFLDAGRLTPLWIILAVILLVTFGSGISYLIHLTSIPDVDQQYQQFSEVAYTDPFILQILSICIVGPIAEELTFRGLIYRRIRDYVNVPVAVILSSLLFGLFHMNLTQGLFASTLGIVLALIYERTGHLVLAIIGHMANNTLSVLAVNLPGKADFISTDTFDLICLAVSVVLIIIMFVLKKPAVDKNIPEKTRKSYL